MTTEIVTWRTKESDLKISRTASVKNTYDFNAPCSFRMTLISTGVLPTEKLPAILNSNFSHRVHKNENSTRMFEMVRMSSIRVTVSVYPADIRTSWFEISKEKDRITIFSNVINVVDSKSTLLFGKTFARSIARLTQSRGLEVN